MHKLTITNEDINIVVDNINEYIKYIEKLTNIIWKIIPNYANYIISEYGDIINIKSKKILKNILSCGYYYIFLCKNNVCKKFSIHRLVYNTFTNKDIEKFDVHHKDQNKIYNHYSNLEKMTKSTHSKYHHNLEAKEHLKKCEKLYNLKYKDNLLIEEIADKYNILEYTINNRIKDYKIFLYLDKNIDKYNYFTTIEKNDLYTNVISINSQKEKLKKCENIYNLKYKDNLSIEEIAKKYNFSKRTINQKIQNYKIYYYLNKNFNIYNNLSEKEKNELYSNTILIENQKKYLKECENIYNLRYKDNLSIEEIVKRYNIPKSTINKKIQNYKVFKFLNKNIDKYNNFSDKEKDKILKDIAIEDKKNKAKKYLEKCRKIYNFNYYNNRSTREISKIYNIPKSTIKFQIKNYKIFLYLNKNIDKYITLSNKEKNQLYNKILVENRNKNNLILGKKIEDLKSSGLIDKDIIKILNISKGKIKHTYKRYKELIKYKELYKIN